MKQWVIVFLKTGSRARWYDYFASFSERIAHMIVLDFEKFDY